MKPSLGLALVHSVSPSSSLHTPPPSGRPELHKAPPVGTACCGWQHDLGTGSCAAPPWGPLGTLVLYTQSPLGAIRMRPSSDIPYAPPKGH